MANISILGWGSPIAAQRPFGFGASSVSDDSGGGIGDTGGGSAGYETTGGGDTGGGGGGGSSGGGASTSSDPSVQQARCHALGLGNWDPKQGKCVTAAEKNRKWWYVGGAIGAVALTAGGYFLATHGY